MSPFSVTYRQKLKSELLLGSVSGPHAIAESEAIGETIDPSTRRKRYIRVSGTVQKDDRTVPVKWEFEIDDAFIQGFSNSVERLADGMGKVERGLERTKGNPKLNFQGIVGCDWFKITDELLGAPESSDEKFTEKCTAIFSKDGYSISFDMGSDFNEINELVRKLESI